MFESSENDIARNVLFGERVKTLLFLSIVKEIPITILMIKGDQKFDHAVIKRGVAKVVSPGTGAEWQKCFTGSFKLDSDSDNWLDIEEVYSVSFSNIQTPHEFLRHEMAVNRPQHLKKVYTGTTGRKKFDIEICDGNDSKYYKLMSSLKT